MQNTYTVSFFGHREIESYNKIFDSIYEIALSLLKEKEYVEFLIGKNGTFDEIATTAIRNARKRYGDFNSALVLVLPYDTAEFEKNENAFYERYSEIEIFKARHYKSAILDRNKSMIDRSDLIIFYLNFEKGGVFKAYNYALKKNKKIINVALYDFDEITELKF